MADQIKQRIALEGGDDIDKQLQKIGESGEQAFTKLGEAAKKSDDTIKGGLPSVDAIKSAADRVGISFDEMKQRVVAASEAFGGAKQAMDDLGQASAGAGGFLDKLSSLFKTSADAAGTAGEGVKGVTENLAVFSKGGALVAGIGIIVSGIAEIAREALNAAEAAGKLETRLTGLAGAKVGDELGSGVQKLARDLGTLPEKIEPALEALVKLQQLSPVEIELELRQKDNGEIVAVQKNIDATNVKAKEATETIRTLFELFRIGGASTADAAKGLGSFFDEAAKKGEISGDMLRRINDLAPQAAKTLTELLSGTGQSAQEFAKQIDKAPIAFKDFQQALQEAGPKIDAQFKDLLQHPRNLSEALEKVARDARSVFDALTGGPGGSNALSSGIVSAITAISEAVKGKLLGIIDDVKAVGNAIGSMFDGIKNNSAVIALFEGIKSALDGIAEAAARTGRGLAQIWANIAEGANAAWEHLKRGAALAWDDIKRGAALLAADIGKVLSAIGVGAVWDDIAAAAKAAFDAIKAAASAVGDVLGQIWHAIAGGARLTWGDLTRGASAAWEAIKSGAAQLADGISQALSAISGGQVWNSIAEAAGAAWQQIKDGAAQLGSAISQALSAIGGGEIWSSIAQAANSAWQSITQGAQQLGSDIGQALASISSGEAWQAIADAAQSAWETISQGASDLGTGIVDAFSSIGDAINQIFSGIADTINQILSGIVATVSSVIASITSAISGISGGGGGGAAGFAVGGYTGSGGVLEPAGVVHRGEYVQPAHVVRQPGVLAFMEMLRQAGGNLRQVFASFGAMPRGFSLGGLADSLSHRLAFEQPRLAYDTGGLVNPPAPPQALHPVTISLGNGQSVSGLSAPINVVKQLERAAVLEQMRGGRTPSRGSR